MLNIVLFIVLCTEVLLFTAYDNKAYGNVFSPVVILSYPALIIIALALFLGPLLGYKPLSTDLLLLFIAGIFIFWCGSLFWSVIIPAQMVSKFTNQFVQTGIPEKPPFKKILLIFAWMVIAYMLFSFAVAYRSFGSISAIASNEFTYSYGGSGWAGHILGLSIPLLIYFIGIAKRKDYPVLITIFFLVIISLLYQVKTWLYIPLIGGILLRYYYKGKFRIKITTIILFVMAIMLLFGLSYAFSVSKNENSFEDKIVMLLKHFTGFIFAGVLGFGEHLNNHMPVGGNVKELFMPFINLYNVIAGNQPTGVVSPYHVLIDEKGLVDVNVKTFFGTILINGGYLMGIVYTFCLSIILYFIWIVASISKNYWFVILYVLMTSALVIGWFDFYYNQLPFVELPVYILLFILFTHRSRRTVA